MLLRSGQFRAICSTIEGSMEAEDSLILPLQVWRVPRSRLSFVRGLLSPRSGIVARFSDAEGLQPFGMSLVRELFWLHS